MAKWYFSRPKEKNQDNVRPISAYPCDMGKSFQSQWWLNIYAQKKRKII